MQVLFWLAAAALVGAAHLEIDPLSIPGGAVLTLAAIFGAAWAYTRFCAPHCGISHALGVGIAWLVLAIVTEMAMTARLGHGWYALLGAPAHPLLRNVILFAWVFAPSFFARGEEEA